MKPRLIRYRGVWHCYLKGTAFHVQCGLGLTPKDAWIDWRVLMNRFTFQEQR
jgi:hypothetical protein